MTQTMPNHNSLVSVRGKWANNDGLFEAAKAIVMHKANKDLDAHAEAHPDQFNDPRRYHKCPECGLVYFGTTCGCKKVGM